MRPNLIIRILWLLVIVVSIFTASPLHQAVSQTKPEETATPSLCNRNEALEMIGHQIDNSRRFDNAVNRISILIRAADLLWQHQQERARATFIEAFDVAARYEKEREAQPKQGPRSLIMEMQRPDQRYVVIRAVARRDSAWAAKLTQQMLRLDREGDEHSTTRDSSIEVATAQKLLELGAQLIPTDIEAAINLARASLNYPASVELSRFLYKLAEVNQQAADQMYDQAVAVYADRPLREFLYLQAYPFAFRQGGDLPVFGNYEVPATFLTNSSLQRRFVQTLLRRAQLALEALLDDGDNYNGLSGKEHLVQVLVRIEPEVRRRLPDLLEAVIQAREKIFVSLAEANQKIFKPAGGNEASPPPERNFGELIETAAKRPDVNTRDDMIAEAVLSGVSDKESLETVVETIEKINDSSIRSGLLEWLYFRRAKNAASNKRFEEAERLTARVEGLEQRAYLHIETARGLMNAIETQSRALALLDEAITKANKAGPSIFSARSLLTAANLYSKIDLSRSISVLGEAINTINRIEAADFSTGDQSLIKTVKRRSNPGRFILRFYMPGLDAESAFREMGKIDFDGTLSKTTALTDKYQLAVTTLALADVCLRQPLPPVQKPKKRAKP
ncbi:MAG TPA: hypothetical protein VJU86_05665 [Pyrinomonadaceae bacterium]|nr:hypothetical protein [Pyrinomonadaceae bacterium]